VKEIEISTKQLSIVLIILLSLVFLVHGVTAADTRSLNITYPLPFVNMGANNAHWMEGTQHTVTWTQTGLAGTHVKIELTDYYGKFVQTLSPTIPATDGSFTWTVPESLPLQPVPWYEIHITSLNYPELTTEGFFSIDPSLAGKSLKLTNPGYPQPVWEAGKKFAITWTQTGLDGTDVELYWEVIPGGDSQPEYIYFDDHPSAESGTYTWTVPDSIGCTECKLPFESGDLHSIGIISVRYGLKIADRRAFTWAPSSVTSKTLKVTAPTSSHTWQTGTGYDISWTQTGLEGTNVKIELKDSINPFVLVRTVTASTPASDGSYYWTVPSDVPPGTTYSIHVTSINDPSVMSYGWLTILPGNQETDSIIVTAPNGDQIWQHGSDQPITWTQTGLDGTTVSILLMKGPGFTIADTIGSSVPVNRGSYSWTVPATLEGGDDYWIKIRSDSNSAVQGDMTGGSVTIVAVSEGTGKLSISSQPVGALVYVDNLLKGKTPCTIEDLRPGQHTLSVELPGYAPWTTQVEITGASTLTLSATLIAQTTSMPVTTPKIPSSVLPVLGALSAIGFIAVFRWKKS
jgi:hypothetical protein